MITEPGVYDMPDTAYHADPVPGGSLSQSGAKKLLSSPARFAYDRDHPPEPKPQFDIGHAAHKLVLGTGPELVVIDAADWRSKASQQARDEAHAAGKVPLLTHEHEQVQAMAAAIREHPLASVLFDPDHGKPEQSMFWTDPDTGVWLRARLDWLPDQRPDGRLIVPDYKTTTSAAPSDLGHTINKYRYHMQAPWYLDGLAAVADVYEAAFLFVFQEKTPPYLVTVAQPDDNAMLIGRDLNRRAVDLYAKCAAADHWPGYTDDIELVSLPAWAERNHEWSTT